MVRVYSILLLLPATAIACYEGNIRRTGDTGNRTQANLHSHVAIIAFFVVVSIV